MKRKKHKIIFLTTLTLLLFSQGSISGTGYEINNHIITSGTTSTSVSGFSITGSIGQPLTSESTGGNYKVTSGFWYVNTNNSDLIFANSYE